MAAEIRAELGGAVLLLDDLQWGDADPIELLPALGATGPLLVTVRPGGDSSRRATKQIVEIGEAIELGPLAPDHALELARHHAGPDDPRALAAAERAGGNPLAIAALAGARTDADTDTLRAFIESCPGGARATLARLSLHDETVDAESDGVGELVERKLVTITPRGRVSATADLFAELALASLDRDEQTELHRRLAASTLDRGEAARHWLAAGDLQCAYAAATAAAADAPATASSWCWRRVPRRREIDGRPRGTPWPRCSRSVSSTPRGSCWPTSPTSNHRHAPTPSTESS
jgi:hypothetical protein